MATTGTAKSKAPAPAAQSNRAAAIRNANSPETYRDGFRNLSKIVNILSVIILLLTILDLYMVIDHHPSDTFYADSDTGKQTRLVGLYEPNNNKNAILSWAEEAAASAMTFGFNDYDKRLNDSRFYFTPKGWAGFSASIKEKGIVSAVINQQQLMTAIPKGDAILVSEGINKGEYTWVIQVPLLLAIRTGDKKTADGMMVTLYVVKRPTSETPRGIGIDRWISM